MYWRWTISRREEWLWRVALLALGAAVLAVAAMATA